MLFCCMVIARRALYRLGVFKTISFSVPVIVVGNITVGGSGKTPLVAALVEQLRKHGYKPGIVSRGYGGKADSWPQNVTPESDAVLAGDEAVLLSRRSNCPVVVGPDRVAAIDTLLSQHGVDIVISDDGLQHYRMGRAIEIAVLDGERRLGNALCLPAGPLREGAGRLKSVDFTVTNGTAEKGEWEMRLIPSAPHSLFDDSVRELSQFAEGTVHAVAGIGNPGRFFQTLREAGLELIEHPYNDHHPFAKGELDFADTLEVIMTEKDAVKYLDSATHRHWYLPVTASLDEGFFQQLLERLEKHHGQKTA